MSIESYVLKLQQEKNPGIIEKLVLEFLSGLSWLYGKGVNKRRIKAQKQAVKVSVPVISVGNITAGGKGKTPCPRGRGAVCYKSRGSFRRDPRG